MKSGNDIARQQLQNDFSDLHANSGCHGTWTIELKSEVPYQVDGLGMIMISAAPFVKCSDCDAVYFAPGFERALKLMISKTLINDVHALDKRHLRFLRVFAGLTQQQVADVLNMDVKEYNKFESLKVEARHLSVDRQFRLRVYYADKLDLDVTELIKTAGRQDPDQFVALPKRFEPSPSDIKVAL